ncbi:cyclophilin-like fold protein [Trichococcus alkaliphilus]|uniref:cyclophilin-like fold protein n=1 Tax=Trichococcus alkaliphilus TaxID=2052943 RepID=UPI000D0BB20F|nr:cyclophilin-like fold protein [Trichococcus alkaliphilus]
MPSMTIKIGNTGYPVALYENATVQALTDKLPMTLEMEELNGNEKYYYFPDSLPSESRRVGSIKAGELMLYGSDCLVIFYKGLLTPYSYTPIGRIEDTVGLAHALGRGSVEVTFSN